MTTSYKEFEDLADKVFVIEPPLRRYGVGSTLNLERGTRSFAVCLLHAGFKTFGDLEGVTVGEVIHRAAQVSPSKSPTTRNNFNKVLKYLQDADIRLG